MLKTASIHYIQPQDIYDSQPYAYSHIARINLEKITEIVHISGQGGENRAGNRSNCFEQQCKQVFLNLQHALKASELGWHNIANMTILIVDHSNQRHQVLIKLMQQYFTEPNFPTCTLIPVPCLALADMQIEISATAYRFK